MDSKVLARLQLDFSRLRQRVDSLEHENASLRSALEDSGALKFQDKFWADVHRRRFEAKARKNPGSFQTTFGSVLMMQSVVSRIADFLQDISVCAVAAPRMPKADTVKERKQPNWPLQLLPDEGESTIFVIGGNDDTRTMSSGERYCPASDQWEAMPPMKQARSSCAATTLNGLIYVCGGNHCGSTLASVECFDPQKGTWESLHPMVKNRSACAVAALLGKLYVCGGWNGKQALAQCERYDPQRNKWEQIPPMNHKREWPALTVDDNQLYLCGGQDGCEDIQVCEAYDPKRSAWEVLPLQVKCRRNAAAAVVNSVLYSCGGHGADGRGVLNTVERFLPTSLSWEPVSPMLTNRRNAMALVIAGRIYVCGGRGYGSRGQSSTGGGHALRNCERFDPVTGTWEILPPMNARRYRAACVVLPNTDAIPS